MVDQTTTSDTIRIFIKRFERIEILERIVLEIVVFTSTRRNLQVIICIVYSSLDLIISGLSVSIKNYSKYFSQSNSNIWMK